MAGLLAWAVQADGPDYHRGSYDGETARLWPFVSTSSVACRRGKCPFADECVPLENRMAVASACVIVTNHAMISTQATKAIPAVIGSPRLGVIDHLVCDEAHTLANVARSVGESSVDERAVRRLSGRIRRTLADQGHLADQGYALGDELTQTLRMRLSHDGTLELAETELDTLGTLAPRLLGWAKSVIGAIPRAGSDDPRFPALRSLKDACDQFIAALSAACVPNEGHARWIERGPNDCALKTSPVDVASILAANLYLSYVPAGERDEDGMPTDEPWRSDLVAEHRWMFSDASEAPFYRLSTSMVSATLTPRFGFEVGVGAGVEDFVSPFGQAYAGSAVYYADGDDAGVLSACGILDGRGKFKLDPRMHAQWAREQIIELVRASGGAALVLTANSANGKAYAAALRQANLGVPIYDQWGGSSSKNVAAWRANESSVMVGTKSLMTGVDAPGQTCSLVVLDRIPRAPRNPVDEARVRLLIDAGVNRWEADRLVYAVDASLLTEQAVGRLVRSINDSGMIAMLDPRMLLGSKASYPVTTARTYNEPLIKFGTHLRGLGAASAWLREHRARNPLVP